MDRRDEEYVQAKNRFRGITDEDLKNRLTDPTKHLEADYAAYQKEYPNVSVQASHVYDAFLSPEEQALLDVLRERNLRDLANTYEGCVGRFRQAAKESSDANYRKDMSRNPLL